MSLDSETPRRLGAGWSMATKLVASALLLSIVPIAIIGWLSDLSGSAALLDQQAKALEAVRTSRQNAIQAYFQDIRAEVLYLVEQPFVVEALGQFSAAFRAAPDQLK